MIKIDIRNVDIVVHNLRPTATKIINYRLEFAGKKRQKREKMMKKQKIKAMVAKCKRTRKKISLSIDLFIKIKIYN